MDERAETERDLPERPRKRRRRLRTVEEDEVREEDFRRCRAFNALALCRSCHWSEPRLRRVTVTKQRCMIQTTVCLRFHLVFGVTICTMIFEFLPPRLRCPLQLPSALRREHRAFLQETKYWRTLT